MLESSRRLVAGEVGLGQVAAVGRADHHRRYPDAACFTVHDDRRSGQGVDDGTDGAGRLDAFELGLKRTAPPLDQRDRAGEPVAVRQWLAGIEEAAGSALPEDVLAIVDENQITLDGAGID